ncbi:MAG: serine/threonine protein kinase, partial [Deltaproteobacteria bacterium]|nr:serine/threonine protein kinase [Deltaproteobacteria bacterium]
MTAAMAANGDLELLEPIAEGGVGVVYRGRLGATPVAVKIVRDELSGSEPVRELMRTEAAVLRALAHPGIVSLIELRDDGDPILVLEWLPGCALHEVGNPRLPVGRALRIIDQLLAALACVHDRGFVHGDVKPSNMIVDPARGDRVTLIDFGLAAAVGVAPDRGPAGTVGFAAPEVFAGAPPRASADVYSAGVVLLSLLGGPVSPGVGSAAPTT